jgi:integrase
MESGKWKRKGENIMNAIAKRIEAVPAANIRELAMRIARESPELKDLDQAQLDRITEIVIGQGLVDEMKAAVKLAGINYEREKSAFLAAAGASAHTKKGYRAALARLDSWAAAQGINPLELKPMQADDYLYWLRAEEREATVNGEKIKVKNSAAPVRLAAAAASSFYTWLHRRHTAVENPFRGTKAEPVKAVKLPTAQEVKFIIRELPAVESAAVAIMSGTGLRIGALPTMEKRADRYHVSSKGKKYYVDLAPSMVKRIEAAGLPDKKPFSGWTANALELTVNYYLKKLFKAGKITAPFTCHDFRHFAANREYSADYNIHRVKEFLHHSSISVTEKYLHAIGAERHGHGSRKA